MTKIKVTTDGPYILSDVSTITRTSDGKTYEVSGNVALCRCGESKNKPFCDGSHKKAGFSGAKDPDRIADKHEAYAAVGLTVHDNRALCAHAGVCTEGLPSVFRVAKEPFVDASGASADAIAETVDRCPSGALTCTRLEGQSGDTSAGPSVVFVPNGPYVLRGATSLEGAELPEGATVDRLALCRCGHSKNKPFCNGAHWNVAFDEDAPKSAD